MCVRITFSFMDNVCHSFFAAQLLNELVISYSLVSCWRRMVKYENQQEPQWTVMFADDCLRSLSRDSMDRVEGSLERWSFTLEKAARRNPCV